MRKRLIILGLILGGAASAQVQPVAQPEGSGPDDVVVVGTADRDKQVRDFVRALTGASSPDMPLARFDMDAVCPAAVGLGDKHDKAIAERMRKVAAAASIAVAKPGCKPNVLVLFARDKVSMIKALRREHPIYFLDANKRPATIPRQRGPATAWHLEGRVDREGNGVNRDPDSGHYVVNSSVTPSRISSIMRPIFMASVVVIDLDALVGLTTTQVADYAAMRSFAQIDPSRLARSNAPTILTVLDAPMNSAVPETLTHWDLAYLKALYAAEANHRAARQKSDIRKRMARELEQAQRAQAQKEDQQ